MEMEVGGDGVGSEMKVMEMGDSWRWGMGRDGGWVEMRMREMEVDGDQGV